MNSDRPLHDVLVIQGTLTCRTGLHVGSRQSMLDIGGGDAPVVKVGERPYIPGSAFKGKLRYLLERMLGLEVQAMSNPEDKGQEVRLHMCDNAQCPVCRLFGNTPVAGQSIPSSLSFRDLTIVAPPPASDENNTASRRKTEWKAENAVDRVQGSATPRDMERVLRDTQFAVEVSYAVREPAFIEQDLRNLFGAFALLEDDFLGGQGSRGYGVVTFSLQRLEVRRGGDAQGEQRKTIFAGQDALDIAGVMQALKGTATTVQTALEESLPTSPVPQPGALEDTIAVKLRFRSPLHVGEVGIGLEGCVDYVPSDTLFSGLCHAWLRLYGRSALEDLLEQFVKGTPPFLLSSAFPFCGEHPFFPRLFLRGSTAFKQADLTWLCLDTFLQWVRGDFLMHTDEDMQEIAKQERQRQRRLADGHGLPETALLPKVRVDRQEARSNLYFCGVVHFPQDGGLFCLLRTHAGMAPMLRQAFEVLGHLGLGGERSTGHGRFEISTWDDARSTAPWQELVTGSFLSETDTDHYTLSLYYPSEADLQRFPMVLVGYELIERGGWIESPWLHRPQARPACRMLREGSVFRLGREGPTGRLVDVTPTEVPMEHRVYRYGYAFNLKLKPTY